MKDHSTEDVGYFSKPTLFPPTAARCEEKRIMPIEEIAKIAKVLQVTIPTGSSFGVSAIQRRLKVGFFTASRIMHKLVEGGFAYYESETSIVLRGKPATSAGDNGKDDVLDPDGEE